MGVMAICEKCGKRFHADVRLPWTPEALPTLPTWLHRCDKSLLELTRKLLASNALHTPKTARV